MLADKYDIGDLLYLMARLRDPETGCPWDLEQTFSTIVPCTLEECYELAAAIEVADFEHVREELGDVLFQVIFYSQLAREEGLFEFSDVVHGLVAKLVRRHPHVFSDGTLQGLPPERDVSTAEIRKNWETIKESERREKLLIATLADIPLNLPALSRAQKVQNRAAGVGFDWDCIDGVKSKLEEEISEFEHALSNESEDAVLEELGDIIFTCVNLVRHVGGDAESVLRRATTKFEQRFELVESILEQGGSSAAEASSAEMNEAWIIAKKQSQPG